MTLTPHLIETNEAERVALYQRGWNDAATGATPAKDMPIMYHIGRYDYVLVRTPRYEVAK